VREKTEASDAQSKKKRCRRRQSRGTQQMAGEDIELLSEVAAAAGEDALQCT
jgi:hypothetical protein